MQDYANLTFNTPSMSTLITWFLNIGVNQHVTPDIASMTSSEPYIGTNQLHVGDGKGLVISHIAHSKIYAPKRTFTLSNILHIPHITKPLLSVQNFCLESNVFFEFHPFVFYVKDLISKGMLFFCRSRDGFYIMSESSATSLPKAFLSAYLSPSADIWYRRLGHPSSFIFSFWVI